MDNPLLSIFDSASSLPPQSHLQCMEISFPGASQIEWSRREGLFEAIFYKDQLEYIALFDEVGQLIEYRMILSAALLPALIKETVESKGELMNSVLINRGNELIYEFIIRDKKLNRFLVEVSQLGHVITDRPL